MLHSEIIFKSMTGPDDTGQVDLQAWMGEVIETTAVEKLKDLDKDHI